MAHRSAPLHPVLRFIYFLLRNISRAGIFVFYRRRLVLGRENLDFDGPAIIVSNHPSTLMDPLNVGINIRQEMFFLANYGLFKNPISNWILSRLYCIPVKRKEDVAEGETRDNDAAFEQSFRHLEKNGLLFIAAEGVSWMNRFVRPFKTGTARIAFGAERHNDWKLGMKILPVGVSYNAPQLFRSRTIVVYGTPIDVLPWKEAFQKDPAKAVDDFTAEIQARVTGLSLHGGDEAGDTFVTQSETILRNSSPGKYEAAEHFLLKKFLDQNLDNQALKNKIAQYFNALEKAGISDAGLAKKANPWAVLGLLLLLPFFLLGYAFWFLPCFLPNLLCKKLKLYPGYDSNVKVLTGLFTFPLALWAGWKLAFGFFQSSLWAWAFLALMVICGYLAEWFLDVFQQWRDSGKARDFQKQNPAEWADLQRERQSILALLHTSPSHA